MNTRQTFAESDSLKMSPWSDLVSNILNVLFGAMILSYLGTTIDGEGKKTLERDDVRRKTIIVLAYLQFIPGIILLMGVLAASASVIGASDPDSLAMLEMSVSVIILLVLYCLLPLITLSYLGFSFQDSRPLQKDDWRRKCMIMLAWFGVARSTILAGNAGIALARSRDTGAVIYSNNDGVDMSTLSGDGNLSTSRQTVRSTRV